MSRDGSEYAWAHFASAAMTYHRGNIAAAVRDADKMLEEHDKRFGPCPLCKGRGHVKGATEDCVQCHGSGDVRPR